MLCPENVGIIRNRAAASILSLQSSLQGRIPIAETRAEKLSDAAHKMEDFIEEQVWEHPPQEVLERLDRLIGLASRAEDAHHRLRRRYGLLNDALNLLDDEEAIETDLRYLRQKQRRIFVKSREGSK